MKINVWVVNWRPEIMMDAMIYDTLWFNGVSVEPYTSRKAARERVAKIKEWYKSANLPVPKIYVTRNDIVLDA